MMSKKLAKYMFIGAANLLFAGMAAAGAGSDAGINMYGGPVYSGTPALDATAALVKAGGGAQHFSIQKALVSMLGEKTVNTEVGKLERQYGKKNVEDWLNGFNFAVEDAVKRATAAGVKLPEPPADLDGVKLAKTLVDAGTAPDNVFWSGLLYDHALSHNIHNRVMLDIDAKYSAAYDQNLHRITNQAMYDVAHALGVNGVMLASLH